MKWQCRDCGEWFYGPKTVHEDCPGLCSTEEEETQKPQADMPMPGLVVSTPEDLARVARHREKQRYVRVRVSDFSILGLSSGIFRRRNMGKIYGIHDSYCDLVGPSGGGPGAAKFCTCDSGKATRRLFDKANEEAEWQTRSEQYADDLINQLINSHEIKPDKDQLVKMRAMLIATWKAGHPNPRLAPPLGEQVRTIVQPLAGAPPAAPEPGSDGPGEEDGPWAPGYESRVSRGDGVALNAVAHPVPPKSDAGKSKPFQFFLQQFPLSFKAVAIHMEKGCSDPGHVFLGWTEVENGFARYTDAMLRHLSEEVEETVTLIDREEGYDREWAEEQSAIAVAANAMIRLELLLRKRRNLNLDARPEV